MQTLTMKVLKAANRALYPVFLKKLKAGRRRPYERLRFRRMSRAARKRIRIYKRNWMRARR